MTTSSPAPALRWPTAWAGLLTLALLLPGCPHRPVQLPADQRLTGVEPLLAALRNRGETLKTLQAKGVVSFRRGGKRVKAHMTASARRPAWLRFETESFFDQPLSILVTDGMSFSMWDLDQGSFLRGPATPLNISRVMPLFLDGPEVVGVLLGDPPFIAYARSELRYDEAAGRYVLSLSNAREQQEVVIHPLRLRPERVTVKAGTEQVYTLIYQDWTGPEQGPQVPERIVFEMPSREILLELRLKEIDTNPALQDSLFILTPPSGITVEQVE
jgi:outer membrane lipoprotein-sorting protein